MPTGLSSRCALALSLHTLGACALPAASEDEVASHELAILGGDDASTDTYPSMVSLQAVLKDGRYEHLCGGTLIAPYWVLTAAHCMDEGAYPPISHAVIGRTDLGNEAIGERIALEAAGTRFHESADLALVHLLGPATRGVTACLSTPDLEAGLAPGDAAWIAGWGFDGSAYPDHLQTAPVELVDRALCNAQWHEQGESVLASELCAGVQDGSRDAEPGDSGGPLFVRDAAGLVLAGVTSWGDNDLDDELSAPGVYVGVAGYLEWIQTATTDTHMLWLSGASRGSFSSSSRTATSVSLPVAGDFDADGKGDVLYYVPGAGKDSLVYGSGRQVALTVTRAYVPLVGDFDGNGYDDVLWYGPGGATDTLWWSASGGFSSVSIEVRGSYRPVVGDFDGDGADDVFWYGPGEIGDTLWWGSTKRTFSAQASAVSGSYQPLAGDFDGDGRDDVFWYRSGTGSDSLWWGNANRSFTSTSTSVDGSYRAFTGDFDGDGRHDVYWYAPGSASDQIWFGTRARGWSALAKNVSGRYSPIVADFDGARGDDVLWYRGAPAKGF